MFVKFTAYGFFLLVVGLSSCGTGVTQQRTETATNTKDSGIRYARRFSISYQGGHTLISLFGNRSTYDTTTKFVLSADTLGLKQRFPDVHIVKTPCRKIAALSSIYAAMLCELGCIDHLVAIDNADYLNNLALIDLHKNGKLRELAKGPEMDLEQAVALSPDIIFTFGMGDGLGAMSEKIERSKLALAVSVDHLEQSPLARAEWIKFFAAFVDRQKEADSIFTQTERAYTQLRSITQQAAKKPTVFSETKFGDVWYMPGGKSYMATILNDAGATYLWADNDQTGSLPLSFEQVFSRAREGDFWINLPLVKSKQDLIAYETRYAQFKAYKTGMLFNNDRHMNAKGYSVYWETGMIHPERILSDLSQIFHPELADQINKEWYYYRQLK